MSSELNEFSQGERVLCYEPDLTKARVIYDAKILNVALDEEVNDGKTKKYLVHFQGWNASWDRYVTKDFLMKDNEQSRKLQKELFQLAEEAIKTKRRKKKSKSGSHIASESSMDESSLNQDLEALSANAIEDSLNSDRQDHARLEEVSASPILSNPPSDTRQAKKRKDSAGEVPLQLADVLKKHLEQDQQMIVVKNKLHMLPAEPNVVDLLETFARYFANAKLLAHEKQFGRVHFSYKKEQRKENLQHVSECVNICKEVVEGLRVMFDFYLSDELLYENERSQFKKLSGIPFRPRRNSTAGLILRNNNGLALKLSLALSEIHTRAKSEDVGGGISSQASSCSGQSTPTLCGNGVQVNSISAGVGVSDQKAVEIEQSMADWKLMDRSCTIQSPPPCLIYGSVHFLRLFVKLPKILGEMKMPAKKLKVFLSYTEQLLNFLETNADLFTHLY